MSKIKYTNFINVESYNISPRDMGAIERYAEHCCESSDNVTSISTNIIRCKKLCEYLENNSIAELKDWTRKDIIDFIQSLEFSYGVTKAYLSFIKDIYKNLRLHTADDITIGDINLSKISKLFLSYAEFQETTEEIIKAEFSFTPEHNMTTFSSIQASAYLMWIGIKSQDVYLVKQSDYLKEERAIRFNNRIYSFSMYPKMAAFFEQYINSKFICYFRGGQTYTKSYVESDSFIKSTRRISKAGTKQNPNKYLTQYYEIDGRTIRYSGCLDRIYQFEQANGSLTKDNIKDVKYILEANQEDDKKFHWEEFMYEYEEYKKLRNNKI